MADLNFPRQSLQQSVLFRGVSSREVERIAAAAHVRRIERGQHVYQRGDEDRRFYVVASGEAELTLDVEGEGPTIVSHIGPGGHFGESALLTDSSYTLSARALSDLTLLCFDANTFNSVLLANKVIQRQLNIAMANRLRVSFHDHANALSRMQSKQRRSGRDLDASYLTSAPAAPHAPLAVERESRLAESTIARQTREAVRRFGRTLEPVLISGETGTGRRMVCHEIHLASAFKSGPYHEVDIREIEPSQLEVELFGYERDPFSFSQISHLGVFERFQGGTVVLYNVEQMGIDFQDRLSQVMEQGAFSRVGGDSRVAFRSRLILICNDLPGQEEERLLSPRLQALVRGQHFRVAPLREHRRDIPRLVQYYLRRYSLQYGKTITQVDHQTLGMLMNYDWPGNLTEMASVLQRAVILGKDNEPLTDQILLGLPKSEGKWEFNLLRLNPVYAFVRSRLFPILPKVIVSLFFLFILGALFFGPAGHEENIGLTLSWVVGWPLLIFSFFFLARTWCSICALSLPGRFAQLLLKPERPTPQFIKRYSGWLMTSFCILLFWVETGWNAYGSASLTAWIILSITLGSLLFSMLFKRRVWCRYLCPLGAINAIFAMPSILELRANTHMCMNRCREHACYTGDGSQGGCPMFRHPFLVDNNRDCILCTQCIKNCQLNSVHLNLRLAPQELWNLQSPRLEDSILVVSLAAIFFPFALNQRHPEFLTQAVDWLAQAGLPASQPLVAGLVFFLLLFVYTGGYSIMAWIMARLTGTTWRTTASILGYGMIPLVLGAFMASHLEIFIDGLWLLWPNFLQLLGLEASYSPSRFLTRDATYILQLITVLGGLIAALYATRRIIGRLLISRPYNAKMFALPALLLCLSALAYLQFV